MTKKATGIVNQIVEVSMGLKSKTKALKTRLIIFWLVKDTKVLLGTNLSPKLHSLLNRQPVINVESAKEEDKKSTLELGNGCLVNNIVTPENIPLQITKQLEYHEIPAEEEDLYQQQHQEPKKEIDKKSKLELANSCIYNNIMTHQQQEEQKDVAQHNGVFEWDEKEIGMEGSVIEQVRKWKEREGEELRLEEEIDHVADLFIKRFRRQLQMDAETKQETPASPAPELVF